MNQPLYPIKLYLKHTPHLVMIPLALLFNLGTWFWLLWNLPREADSIFLHYNILYGVDYIGDWWRAFYIPIAGLVIFLLNTLLAWLLFPKDKFASELLIGVSVFCQVFLFLAGSLLVILNV